MDGDGDLDLLVSQFNGTFVYYANEGNVTVPNFVRKTGAENPLDGEDAGADAYIELGDIDGDGDLDLLVGQFNGTFVYYANEGNVTALISFIKQELKTHWMEKMQVLNSYPSLGDMDGDGDLDLLVGQFNGMFLYYHASRINLTDLMR